MISKFDDQYRFLSNFWFVPIVMDDLVFPSVEHAFQAAKTLDKNDRVRIAHLGTAREAKAYGRKLKLRPDWEEVKLPIMEELLRKKFAWPLLRQALIDTGDQELIEGNWWGDRFWGVDLKTNQGQNHLGMLLMKVRSEL